MYDVYDVCCVCCVCCVLYVPYGVMCVLYVLYVCLSMYIYTHVYIKVTQVHLRGANKVRLFCGWLGIDVKLFNNRSSKSKGTRKERKIKAQKRGKNEESAY